jgi:O-antigen/teichoic acid export membrane protein
LGDKISTAFLDNIIGGIPERLTVVFASLLDPNSNGLLSGAISILTVRKMLNTFGFFKSASRYIADSPTIGASVG